MGGKKKKKGIILQKLQGEPDCVYQAINEDALSLQPLLHQFSDVF